MRLPRSRISRPDSSSIPSCLSSILKTGRGILVPPSALDDAARLRTSVANDENQTQGDSTDRVDEGPRRVDNKKSEAFGCESLLNESASEGLADLGKGRNHESERGSRQRPQ